jgi:Tfp pilus assembly protein PilX
VKPHGHQLIARQRGATLIVALLMLLVSALLAIGAIQSSVMSIRIGRNAQLAQEAQMAAQRAIDSQLSTLATFTGAAAAPATTVQQIDVDGDGVNDFAVTVYRPTCVAIANAKEYSYLTNPPKDTTWTIRATAADLSGGNATADISQGIRVRLPTSADCPA